MNIISPSPLFCGMYVPSFKRDTTRHDEDLVLWDTQHWHGLEKQGALVSRADLETDLNEDPHHDIALLGSDLSLVPFTINTPLNDKFKQDDFLKAALFPVILTKESSEKYTPIVSNEKTQPIFNEDSPFNQYFSLASNTKAVAMNDFYEETLDDLDDVLRNANALAPGNKTNATRP